MIGFGIAGDQYPSGILTPTAFYPCGYGEHADLEGELRDLGILGSPFVRVGRNRWEGTLRRKTVIEVVVYPKGAELSAFQEGWILKVLPEENADVVVKYHDFK